MRQRHIFAARIPGERQPKGKGRGKTSELPAAMGWERALCACSCAERVWGRVRAEKHFAQPRGGQVTSCILHERDPKPLLLNPEVVQNVGLRSRLAINLIRISQLAHL